MEQTPTAAPITTIALTVEAAETENMTHRLTVHAVNYGWITVEFSEDQARRLIADLQARLPAGEEGVQQ